MLKENGRNRDIWNLLAVLGASVVGASLLAFIFIYYYGPNGRYVAGQTILDPSTIQQINVQENSPKGSQKVHFVFDRFEFSFFDPQMKQRLRVPVSTEIYQKFYHLVSSISSIKEKEGELEKRFIRSQPTLLTASMRTLNRTSPSDSKIFQVIEFIEGDYFRVQLHDKQEQGEWAYFYKANSYSDIMNLFTKTASL